VADFISAYAEWIDVYEIPKRMHELVGLQMVASVLNRNGVEIQHGNNRYPLDLWVALLSGSGDGGSTITSVAKPLLKGAGLGNLICNDDWGSRQACWESFSTRKHSLFSWGELGIKLEVLNTAMFNGTKKWITDRYDNFDIPESVQYRTAANPADSTPEIAFTFAPRINIMATSSEAWFYQHLTEEDTTGGFIPRWLLIKVDAEDRDRATPKTADATFRKTVLEPALQRALQFKGDADISGILRFYERDWYSQTKKRFLDPSHNTLLAKPFFNRHRVHVIKLAVILEAAAQMMADSSMPSDGVIRVGQLSWDRAVRLARELEENIFTLIGTGLSGLGYQLTKVEAFILEGGDKGVSLTDYTRRFQDQPKRTQWLKDLYDGDRVVIYPEKSTGGRPPVRIVHSSHWKGAVPAAPYGVFAK
jgi:hypothetical protein